MSEPRDPARWREGASDAPEAFAQLVREDEAAGPDGAQLARMLDGVALAVARPELSQAQRVQTGSGAASGVGAAVKAGIAAIGLGLAAYGAWRVYEAPRATNPHAPAARTAERDVSAPQPAPLVPTPAPAATPVPNATATPDAQGVTPPEPAARAPERRPAGQPPADRSPADTAAELALLEQAQLALERTPARALALAERHRARFARGQFVQEREMLAIDALLRLQRVPEARRRATAFARAHPHSSHLPRLRDRLQAAP